MSDASATCSECGTLVAGNTVGGLCAKCVARFHLLASQEIASGPCTLPGNAGLEASSKQPGATKTEGASEAQPLVLSDAKRTTPKSGCAYRVLIETGGEKAERVVTPSSECTMGRSLDCGIRFNDGHVSSKHARLIIREEQVWIEDLDSANGTLLDGARITTATALKSGQSITLGGSSFQIERIEPVETSRTDLKSDAQQTNRLPDSKVSGRNFEIQGLIGGGGMGLVYAAKDANLGRSVAMKVLKEDRRSKPEAITRFIAEAQIAGQLEHPGIVPVYEMGVDSEGKVFYTMRHIKGVTLSSILKDLSLQKGNVVMQYSLGTLLALFQKVCDAVAYAHSHGVLHRDLKPENIMAGKFGEVFVLDWGLAKVMEGDQKDTEESTPGSSSGALKLEDVKTMAGTVLGTPFYMAPEQAEGNTDQIDPRTEVYALGAVLYEILTLRPPILGKSFALLKERILTGDIRPPSSYRETVQKDSDKPGEVRRAPVAFLHCPDGKIPGPLSAVAMKALAVSPGDRYQSVTDLQKDITAYQTGCATSAELPNAVTLFRLWVRRHKTAALALSAVAILATVFGFTILAMWTELRGTAETFFDKTENLMSQGKYYEALDPIKDAIRLRPKDAEYHLKKGHILQSLLRIAEARRAYQRVLELDPHFPLAQENLALCQRILLQNPPGTERTPAVLAGLQVAMMKQGRRGESYSMLRQLLAMDKEARDRQYAQWRATLDNAHLGGRLAIDDRGKVELDLGGTSVTDLSVLTNIPLSFLDVRDSQVKSLAALEGMPLEMLRAHNCKVSDLRPLRATPLKTLKKLYINSTQITNLTALVGMQLEELDASGVPIGDLRPLSGMPLRNLSISDTRVMDLSPLRGMPLVSVSLSGTGVSDLSPLTNAPIRSLDLSRCNNIRDFGLLQRWPIESLNLRQLIRPLDLSLLKDIRTLRDLDLYETPINDLNPLREMGRLGRLVIGRAPISDISALEEVNLGELQLRHTEVSDLRPLVGRTQLTTLNLGFNRKVSDLTPLAGLRQMDKLCLSNTRVADLSPLKRMRLLRELNLDGCDELKDISLVAEFKETLERLTIPIHFQNQDLEFLRRMTNLNGLGFGESPSRAKDFWKAYDARMKARK